MVEGLAHRVACGDVPAHLREARIIEIKPSAIVANTTVVGRLENRMERIIREASDPLIVLFIDEAHAMVGAGRCRHDPSDVASMLKPPLGRGELRVIAATTPHESWLLRRDPALVRRFQEIQVPPLTAGDTLGILEVLRRQAEEIDGTRVHPDAPGSLVRIAERFLQGRHWPDKGITLLEGCLAHARAHGRACLEVADCERVAHRLVGAPLDVGERAARACRRLEQEGVIDADLAQAITGHLARRSEGSGAERGAYAVILAEGLPPDRLRSLTYTLAEEITGGLEQLVHTAAWGEPAGRAALETAAWILALEGIAVSPRSVWHIEAVDELDGAAQRLLARRLALGFWTADALGRVAMTGTIVVLSVSGHLATRRPVGFRVETPSPVATRPPVARVVAELLATCDIVIPVASQSGHPPRTSEDRPSH